MADSDDRLAILERAEIDIVGRMRWSSNATFLVDLRCGDAAGGQAIYKPTKGERPLWDFEPGLHRRELAAYLLSEAMGLHMVPPTIIRDGPLGEGSLQWFVESDPEQHYFTLAEQRPDLHDRLRELVVFDVVANNTDRKSGHVLIDADDTIWGIDHGLTFAADFKLRTVIWEFAGEPVPPSTVAALEQLCRSVPLEICTLLDDDEVEAVQERARWLLEHRKLPTDPSGRRYPWPLV